MFSFPFLPLPHFFFLRFRNNLLSARLPCQSAYHTIRMNVVRYFGHFIFYCVFPEPLLSRLNVSSNGSITSSGQDMADYSDIGYLFYRFGVSESESASYSIHLKKSITWCACGNGQKEKHEGKQDER